LGEIRDEIIRKIKFGCKLRAKLKKFGANDQLVKRASLQGLKSAKSEAKLKKIKS
jgi:hypothetical protein